MQRCISFLLACMTSPYRANITWRKGSPTSTNRSSIFHVTKVHSGPGAWLTSPFPVACRPLCKHQPRSRRSNHVSQPQPHLHAKQPRSSPNTVTRIPTPKQILTKHPLCVTLTMSKAALQSCCSASESPDSVDSCAVVRLGARHLARSACRCLSVGKPSKISESARCQRTLAGSLAPKSLTSLTIAISP